METLNWKNLKRSRCPKCNHMLKGVSNDLVCSEKDCGFKIGNERAQEIINSFVERELETDTRHFREEGWG